MEISKLPKLWLFDLDGTLVKHNGYLIDGKDTLLDGAKEFLDNISKEDKIFIITARKKKYAFKTKRFLKKYKIRFDKIFFDMPVGERILINDKKPKGLLTSVAINTVRDQFMNEKFEVSDI